MKLSECKEYLPFVQAAAEGKTIQIGFHVGHPIEHWEDAEQGLDLDNYAPHRLRIKSTPTLRPFRSDEVPIGSVLKDKKVCDTFYLLTYRNGDVFGISKSTLAYTALQLFEQFTFIDGKPFGTTET